MTHNARPARDTQHLNNDTGILRWHSTSCCQWSLKNFTEPRTTPILRNLMISGIVPPRADNTIAELARCRWADKSECFLMSGNKRPVTYCLTPSCRLLQSFWRMSFPQLAPMPISQKVCAFLSFTVLHLSIFLGKKAVDIYSIQWTAFVLTVVCKNVISDQCASNIHMTTSVLKLIGFHWKNVGLYFNDHPCHAVLSLGKYVSVFFLSITCIFSAPASLKTAKKCFWGISDSRKCIFFLKYLSVLQIQKQDNWCFGQASALVPSNCCSVILLWFAGHCSTKVLFSHKVAGQLKFSCLWLPLQNWTLVSSPVNLCLFNHRLMYSCCWAHWHSIQN